MLHGYENKPSKCQKCRDKDKICSLFASSGECRYGDNCRFSHDSDESGAGITGVLGLPPPASIPKECSRFADGKCLNGDSCPFQHSGREVAQKDLSKKLKLKKENGLLVAARSALQNVNL